MVAAPDAASDRLDRWIATTRETYRSGHKRVYYLSLEFLIGRLFRDAAANLNLLEPLAAAGGRHRRVRCRSSNFT